MPYARPRRVVHWACTALALFFVALWGAACRWELWYIGSTTVFSVREGCVWISRIDPRRSLGWQFGRNNFTDKPDGPRRAFILRAVQSSSRSRFIVPLWPWSVALLVGAWTPWRRLMKSYPNRCTACGYDRSGLSPYAVCPECGHHVMPPRASK